LSFNWKECTKLKSFALIFLYQNYGALVHEMAYNSNWELSRVPGYHLPPGMALSLFVRLYFSLKDPLSISDYAYRPIASIGRGLVSSEWEME
jgi:hypothetical protein